MSVTNKKVIRAEIEIQQRFFFFFICSSHLDFQGFNYDPVMGHYKNWANHLLETI